MRFIHLHRKQLLYHLPLIILLLIASLEFGLLLRHKSPYVSDSYFYQHMFYELQGDSFNEAQTKILNKLKTKQLSDVEKNIFFNPDKYEYSLSQFLRRPLYPFTAYILNIFLQNEYLAFIIPVFASYLSCIALTYLLFRFRFDRFWSTLGTALFLRFYPFLDWSTYFMTDTIGAFFWLLQLYLVLLYVKKPRGLVMTGYLLALIISIFNREQSMLMVLTLFLLFGFRRLYVQSIVRAITKLFVPTLVFTVALLVVNSVLKLPSLYVSWTYLQSNFGYFPLEYTWQETARFLFDALIQLHTVLVLELIRHRWWFIITLLGIGGVYKLFMREKKPRLIDTLMLASSVAAYVGLIIVPFLTYRHFYPTIIGVIYFSLYMTQSFFYGKTQRALPDG